MSKIATTLDELNEKYGFKELTIEDDKLVLNPVYKKHLDKTREVSNVYALLNQEQISIDKAKELTAAIIESGATEPKSKWEKLNTQFEQALKHFDIWADRRDMLILLRDINEFLDTYGTVFPSNSDEIEAVKQHELFSRLKPYLRSQDVDVSEPNVLGELISNKKSLVKALEEITLTVNIDKAIKIATEALVKNVKDHPLNEN